MWDKMHPSFKYPNETFASPYYPGFSQQAAFSPAVNSFYLALGSGFLDTLIRQPSLCITPTLSLIESLVPQLEALTSPLGMRDCIQVFTNLLQALTAPPKVLQQRLTDEQLDAAELGNVVAPEKVINKFGAEILRLWVATQDYRNDTRVGDAILKQVSMERMSNKNRKELLLIWAITTFNLRDWQTCKHILNRAAF